MTIDDIAARHEQRIKIDVVSLRSVDEDIAYLLHQLSASSGREKLANELLWTCAEERDALTAALADAEAEVRAGAELTALVAQSIVEASDLINADPFLSKHFTATARTFAEVVGFAREHADKPSGALGGLDERWTEINRGDIADAEARGRRVGIEQALGRIAMHKEVAVGLLPETSDAVEAAICKGRIHTCDLLTEAVEVLAQSPEDGKQS